MGNDGLAELTTRLGSDVVYMTTGGFEYLIKGQGGEFLGFSARSAYSDALLVIRADFDGKVMVGFVSSSTTAGAISRAHKELRDHQLKWSPCKYSNGEG